jgi:hypothetical protein
VPGDKEIRIAVPTLIALIPAFTEEMNALNNDVAAVLVFSFLLWGIARMMRDGVSILSLLWVCGAAILAFFTKRTTMVGILVGIIAILMAVRIKWWAWTIGGIAILASVLLALSWTGSASWYELESAGPNPIRVQSDAPVGKHVMCVEQDQSLVQDLSRTQVRALLDKTVTLGGWVRSASQVETGGQVVVDDRTTVLTTTVPMSFEWTFYALTTTVDAETTNLQVRLPISSTWGTICHDGVVLAEGEFPLDQAPQFGDPNGKHGTWAGRPFANLLSNGSGERTWPRLKPWASRLLLSAGLTRSVDPTLFVQSILDWKRTGWVYRVVWTNVWNSFWARFGWNHVAMPEPIYTVLLVCTWLGLGGMIIYGVRYLVFERNLPSWQKHALISFLSAIVLVWANALVWYSHPYLLNLERIYYAVARYVYPTVVPTVLFLYLGWRELLPKPWRPFLPIVSIVGLACLDIAALMGTILPYYYLS